jgi:hypothetical protein
MVGAEPDALQLSSRMTGAFRILAAIAIVAFVGIGVYALASGPMVLLVFASANAVVGVQMSWPYLILTTVRQSGTKLIVGRHGRIIEMKEIVDVGAIRFLRPRVVYIRLRAAPSKRIVFLPRLSWGSFGRVSPVVPLLGRLAAAARKGGPEG